MRSTLHGESEAPEAATAGQRGVVPGLEAPSCPLFRFDDIHDPRDDNIDAETMYRCLDLYTYGVPPIFMVLGVYLLSLVAALAVAIRSCIYSMRHRAICNNFSSE